MLYPREPEYIRLKVDAVNRCHDLANQIYKQMVDAFLPFVGKKIINSDQRLSKAVAAKIPKPVGDGQKGVHVFFYPSNYNVGWEVRVTVWDGSDNHVDHTAHVYVGKLNGYDLEAIEPADRQLRRCDYDFDHVMLLRKRAAALRKDFDEAQSACFPFEDDSLRR